MEKSKSKRLPRFGSVNKLIEHFDTHDMGEYWEQMPAADFEVDLKRRCHLVAINESLMTKLAAVAKAKHVSSQRLVNSRLEEKLLKVS